MPIEFSHCQEYVYVPEEIFSAGYSVDSLRLNLSEALGSGSRLSVTPLGDYLPELPSRSLFELSIMSVVLLCVYCYIFFRYIRPIRQLFKSSITIESSLSMIDNPSRDFHKFLAISRYLSVLLFSGIVTVFLYSKGLLPSPTLFIYYLGILGIVFILYYLRIILRKLGGASSDSRSYFDNIAYIENFNYTLSMVIISPFVVFLPYFLFLQTLLPYILILVYVYHLVRLYLYMRGKKFSNMQWFLYLCGVELLPVVLVITTIVIINSSLIKLY